MKRPDDTPEALSLERAQRLEIRASDAESLEAAELWTEAAVVYGEIPAVPDALRCLRNALRVAPEHRVAAQHMVRLAEAHEHWSDLASALDLLASSERDVEARMTWLLSRAEVLSDRLGRVAEARSLFREVERSASNPVQVSAAIEAIESLDGRRGSGRTTLAPIPGRLDRPHPRKSHPPENPRVLGLVHQARRAMVGDRKEEGRSLIEQALALDPWSREALSLRHDLLLEEGRYEDLVRVLKAEAAESPHPDLARDNTRRAAQILAEQLGDFERALDLYREGYAAGADEQALDEAIILGYRHRVWGVARKLMPDVDEADRAARLEALAQAAAAVGDQSAARAYRAIAFEDRPDVDQYFEARAELCRLEGDLEGVLRVHERRLAHVREPSRRILLLRRVGELNLEAGRARAGIVALVKALAWVERDEDALDLLSEIAALSKKLDEPGLYARALEAVMMLEELSPLFVADRLVELGRWRRDVLVDIEGAETVLARAAALGSDVAKEELAALRRQVERLSQPAPPTMPADPPESEATQDLSNATADLSVMERATGDRESGVDWLVRGVPDSDLTPGLGMPPAEPSEASTQDLEVEGGATEDLGGGPKIPPNRV